MTDFDVKECNGCGTHLCEDEMKQGADENWYCPECYYPEPQPDLVDFMSCKEDR